jgi:hypothetical protein
MDVKPVTSNATSIAWNGNTVTCTPTMQDNQTSQPQSIVIPQQALSQPISVQGKNLIEDAVTL